MENIEKIYFKMKIISQIKRFAKLKVSDHEIKLDPPSFFQGIKRYYNGDNRDASLAIIYMIMKDLGNIIDYILNNLEEKEIEDYKSKFIMIIPQTIHGLENLKRTYRDDDNANVKIEHYQETLREYITKLRN